MRRKAVIFFLSLCLISPSFALFGTRPMGMGGAFTAVANDANAGYWNPAGLALNPEVSISGSTMANNRNTWVGDNVLYSKFCYETEMNPFEWIAGVGAASVLAMQSAQYLSDQGVLKKGWGREGETTTRDQSMASQVKGTQEVVSLTKLAKETAKKAVKSTIVVPSNYYLVPVGNPWYYHPHYHPYWEPQPKYTETKAQFALGVSWLNDYNPPLDQNSNWYTFSLASGFEQRVAVGGSVNIFNLKKISTDIAGLGGDIDLGVIAKPVDYISLGAAVKGILTTDITWQDGSTTRYQMQPAVGIAIQPLPSLTLAADVHNLFYSNATCHYGVEASLIPGIIGRAGFNDGSKTCGLTLALGRFMLDWAYLGGAFNRTQMIGATIQL
ncbi:MAG: hypothetical protein QME05_01725 [Candidatus Margulisbacteria bacterium]|nr:hypothetical protein [Candidatus Margulisiibacteriota bacterium]